MKQKAKRRSYTIDTKLAAIRENEAGKSIRSIGKDHGIDESVIRGWLKNQNKLKTCVDNKNVSVRKSRKIGSGRKAFFPELENRLVKWVRDRNLAGLRVKDKYIEMTAKSIRDELIKEAIAALPDDTDNTTRDDIKKLEGFVVSNNWLARFKGRFDLVSRRHTTSRSLPDGFDRIACNFVSKIQSLIADKKIHPSRIVNLDQVPRYFETENSSTIIQRGTKEVTLRKSSSSHKRFTATPIIAAHGKFVGMHLLFSNLKKIPKNIDPSCMVDVNDTGMWNDAILSRVLDEVVKKVQSPIYRQPVLILIDSYGTHLKLVQQKGASYERKNVFIRVIPPNMTGLLQPLDVAINRSFQQEYGDKYNEHLQNALKDKEATKAGSVKMPKYHEISSWVSEWMKKKTPESITKAFELCGFVDPTIFRREDMHKPLRDCFAADFSAAQWIEQHGAAFNNFPDCFEEANTDWIFYDVAFSFYKAIYEVTVAQQQEDYEFWLGEFKVKVIEFIDSDPLLKSLFKDDERGLLESGKCTGASVEMYAVSRILKVQLKVTTVDKFCTKQKEYNWGEKDFESEIDLLQFEEIFGHTRKLD